MATRSIDSQRIEALQECYYRPARSSLGAALAVARDGDTAADTWESMAARAVVPFEEVLHPTRRFVAYTGEDAPTEACLPHPPTRETCAAFASDLTGVLAAEELAREYLARLAPWGVAATSVRWLTGEGHPALSLRASGCALVLDTLRTLASLWAESPRAARYALRDRSRVRRERLDALKESRRARREELFREPDETSAVALSPELCHAQALWNFARDEFLHVSRLAALRERLPYALVGVRVGALRSPFEVVAAIYRLGYGLGPLTNGALHLTAVGVTLAADGP